MNTWRKYSSSRAQQSLEDLLNLVLPFAQQQLAQRGQFFPYAAAMQLNGEPELIAPPTDHLGTEPPALDVIGACVLALREKRHLIQAAALAADAYTESEQAIRIDLEHVEGLVLRVHIPYTAAQSVAEVTYGALRVSSGLPQIWPPSDPLP